MAQENHESDLRTALGVQLNLLNAGEAALVKFMPKLVLAGSSVQFRSLVAKHLQETEAQAARLTRAAKEEKFILEKGDAPEIEALIAETRRIMAEEAPPLMKDLHLTESARRIERAEIAAYERACALAEEAGESKLKVELTKTLKEEDAAEHLLEGLAGEISAGSIQKTPEPRPD